LIPLHWDDLRVRETLFGSHLAGRFRRRSLLLFNSKRGSMTMRGREVFRLAAGFALFLVLLGASFSHAIAGAGTQTITIHNRICPTGYTGSALFADCHGNPQTDHLDFTISGSGELQTQATDDNGNVTFNSNPGSHDISGGVPGEFASTVVYCSVNRDQIPSTQTDTGYSVTVPDGEDVICDWYNIPEDLSGLTPTPAPTSTPTTTLPNTGAGETTSESSGNYALLGFAIVALGATAFALRRRVAR
jgi:hypothetical protein